MTNEYQSTTSGDGSGVITRDAKAGQIVNVVVTAAGLALADALTKLDFSTFPHAVAVLAPPVVGLITGWITTKVLPRFKR
jgi:uncharacterized membrane protein